MILESFAKNYKVLEISPVVKCVLTQLFLLMAVIIIYGIISPFMVTLGGWYSIVSFILWLVPITYALYLVQKEDIYLHHK